MDFSKYGIAVEAKINELINKGTFTLADVSQVQEHLDNASEEDIISSLTVLDGTDLDKIKNVAGYLSGILKRKNENAPSSSSLLNSFTPFRQLPTLPAYLLFNDGDGEYIPQFPRLFEKYDLTDPVQEKVEELATKEGFSASILHGEVIEEIAKLPEPTALQALKEILRKDPAVMRDKERFILGIINRIKNEQGPFPIRPPTPGSYKEFLMLYKNRKMSGDEHIDLHSDIDRQDQGPASKRTRSDHPMHGASGPPGHLHPRPPVHMISGPGRGHGPPPPPIPPLRSGPGPEPGAPMGYPHPMQHHHQGPPPPFYDQGPPPMNTKQAILRELGHCCSMGMIGPDDIDARTIDFLSQYPMQIAMRALQEFFSKDFSRVNNLPNYLKGIVKRVMERESGSQLPPNASRGMQPS